MVYILIKKRQLKKGVKTSFLLWGVQGVKEEWCVIMGETIKQQHLQQQKQFASFELQKKKLLTKLEFVKSLSDCIGHKTATIYSKQ